MTVRNQHLILAGGGHSHALVLRSWAMAPRQRPSGTLISVVSLHSTTLYSGMVPGMVAGLYEPAECAIDLRRLCALAGASFIEAEIVGLNPQAGELQLAGRPPLRFDLLSLDVGAVTAAVGGAMAVKPLEPFLAWCHSQAPGTALRIRGGGAAAVELALAFRARGITSCLLLRGRDLRLGSQVANRAAERLLAAAGITVERQVPPSAAADLACTGSQAPAWLANCGLPVDLATGRVRTLANLRVEGHRHLFAVGDCGLIPRIPRPPSGVWAVRAAPVLARNLKQSLERPGAPLMAWRPQVRALQLLGDGGWRSANPQASEARRAKLPQPEPAARDPQALAVYGPLVLGPYRWLWRWKDRIDQRFMDRFTDLQPMGSSGRHGAAVMACRGCAAKLPAQPLAAALRRLPPPPHTTPPMPGSSHGPGPEPAPREAAVDTSINNPVDAPLVGQGSDGSLLLQSVDGFPALVDDPWLNGRLTTLHACGDLWASGALVDTVQTLVTLPEASAPLQEDLLLQTLAGVRSVLDPLGARLVGGHTLEGRDGAGLSLALTVNGRVAPTRYWPKGPLHPGDALLLSRPIGSGVLFAAAMAGAARPAWIDAALEVMQQSQAPLLELLANHGCQACTDITGFGLLGHLGEMVAIKSAAQSHGVDGIRVRLNPQAIPALPGALELLSQGFASTLAPFNATALELLQGPIQWSSMVGAGSVLESLLVDPQTCGPLLAAVPADQAEQALAVLHDCGFGSAAVIGTVIGTAAPGLAAAATAPPHRA